MGLKVTSFFDDEEYQSNDTQIIVCKQCSSHLCLSSLIISDGFHGSSGPAYLVDKMINCLADDTLEETSMKTGIYLIKKIKCHQCFQVVGWKYIKSYKHSEAYKEKKYVVERAFINFIANNSYIEDLIRKAKRNFRRRLSSNSTINSCDSDDSVLLNQKLASYHDEFRFSDSNMKLVNRIRLQAIDRLNEKDEQSSQNSDDVLVEL